MNTQVWPADDAIVATGTNERRSARQPRNAISYARMSHGHSAFQTAANAAV